MNLYFSNFLKKISFAIIFLCFFAWIIFTFFTPGKYLPILPWMLAFFSLVTISTHAWQTNLIKDNMNRFTRTSMVVSLIRLACYSLFAVIYLAHDSDNAAVFVVCLVIIYITFTSLEVTSLSVMIKKRKNNENE
jgi:hypothetical protein